MSIERIDLLRLADDGCPHDPDDIDTSACPADDADARLYYDPVADAKANTDDDADANADPVRHAQ